MAKRKKAPVSDPTGETRTFEDYLKHDWLVGPNCPPPTRTFQIGERVRLGNLHEPTVVESFEGGKFYRVVHIQKEARRGLWENDEPPVGAKLYGFWPWYSLFPLVEEMPFSFSKDVIRLSYNSMQLESLIHKVLRSGVEMNPDYQRDLVWDDENRHRLLTSIFRGAQIGQFIFRRLEYEAGRTKYDEIVDGKQRLTTIIDYYLDKFAYAGVKYSELSFEDRHHFLGHMVQVAEIREGTPLSEVLKIFLAVNETGKPVEKAHLDKVRERLSSI